MAENSTNGRMKIAAITNAGGCRIDAGTTRRVIRGERREGELEDVVVRGAEELRPEERRETALAEQLELGFVRIVRASSAPGGG